MYYKVSYLIEVPLPTSEEFKAQIEQYESEALGYFLLVMGVSVLTSFLKGLLS